MWPFDIFQRLFEGGDSAEDQLDARLKEFLAREKGLPASTDEARPSGRDLIRAAQRVVDQITQVFDSYTKRKILARFPRDVRMEPSHGRSVGELDQVFGLTRTGNESRYVTVSFRNRFAVHLRVEAIIMSRALDLRAAFVDRAKERPPFVMEVPLDKDGEAGDIKWELVFEKLYLNFLDWCQKPGSGS
ncbi:MAG: hypothetical protein HY815_21775 [Candidatus Riflebacteria bacterium]|nr:hypothetical protein [Candidatus Riflebacteria bacterium]